MRKTSHESQPNTEGMVLHWAFFYDVLLRVLFLFKEDTFRQKILDLALVAPGNSVLDIGCGTGTLALAAAGRTGGSGRVSGIDPSPQMIRRAARKAAKAGSNVEFRIAAAEALPFPDARFDVVLSTLMLHHLPEDVRARCLRETFRVLRKGGRLLIVDFAVAAGRRKSFHGRRHRSIDLELLIQSLKEAGFERVETGEMGYFGLRWLRAEGGRNAIKG